MSLLWTADALVAGTGGRPFGQLPEGITGISIDSRSLQPGEAFFAIKGETMDGHDFATAALKAGAALLVVAEGKLPALGRLSGPIIVVPDVLEALGRLGRAARARSTAKVIAVTGSAGKTSTKEALRHALSSIGKVHASDKSFNNHWGVPLTLGRMPANTVYGVFEIGMNHSGEIRPLTRMVRPHAAIVTTVEPVHLEYFAGEADIAEAKAEIFEGLEPGGAAVLNRDNRWFDLLRERARDHGARIVSFGEHPSADMRLERVTLREDGSSIQAVLHGVPMTYRLGAPGRHLVQNSLAVLAAAAAIGADVTRVALALGQFRAPKGRGERIRLAHPGGGFTLLDESYNANPASMRAALALLGQAQPQARGRRIAVLGDMLELGSEADAMHRGLVEAVRASRADLVFLAGPVMETLWQDLPGACRGAYARSAAELEPILLDAVGPGDVVMIKASLGTKLGAIVEALTRRFAQAAA